MRWKVYIYTKFLDLRYRSKTYLLQHLVYTKNANKVNVSKIIGKFCIF